MADVMQPWIVNGRLVHDGVTYNHGDQFFCSDPEVIRTLRFEDLPEEQRRFRAPIIRYPGEALPAERLAQQQAEALASKDERIAALEAALAASTVKKHGLKETPTPEEA